MYTCSVKSILFAIVISIISSGATSCRSPEVVDIQELEENILTDSVRSTFLAGENEIALHIHGREYFDVLFRNKRSPSYRVFFREKNEYFAVTKNSDQYPYPMVFSTISSSRLELFIISLFISTLILYAFSVVDILNHEFHQPINKLVWILTVLSIPILGALLYIIVGRNQRIAKMS